LHAAQLIDDNIEHQSCIAVQVAANEPSWWKHPSSVSERLLYNRVFNPIPHDPDGMDWSVVMRSLGYENNYDLKEVRVLMLCLMAECWKDF